jgi:hypothetical protein
LSRSWNGESAERETEYDPGKENTGKRGAHFCIPQFLADYGLFAVSCGACWGGTVKKNLGNILGRSIQNCVECVVLSCSRFARIGGEAVDPVHHCIAGAALRMDTNSLMRARSSLLGSLPLPIAEIFPE